MIAPREFASKLDLDLQSLNMWRARIAVIGQVKAGKSTFLGALTHHPGFLPSEVNPWTSVVTNLHFAHPDDPESGGIFHFFDEGAWEKIINGDPETRKLAEDLLPGFRSEVLRMQVETMQARARKRLGEFYHLLLGKQHSYEIVTRNTLERYVCAGQGQSLEVSNGPSGRYSDLTERADIFMPPGPFATPVVLSDTPGVNDPFMVRDEYTCRSLGQAEIFVMILSAHQALTDVDIALLKMLALRDVNEVIIFINRLDEMSDYASAAPSILEDVRRRLAEVIPDRQFRIIVGSAHWAEVALNAEEDSQAFVEATSRPAVVDYLGGFEGGSLREKLLAASGLRSVQQALSDAIDFGQGLEVRNRAAINLSASVDACKTILKQTQQQIEAQLSASPTNASESEMTAEIEDRLVDVGAARDAVAKIADEGRTHVYGAVDEGLLSMRRVLDHKLKDFATETCDAFFQEMSANNGMTEFKLDTLPFRSELEQAFDANYKVARQRLDRALLFIVSKAKSSGEEIVSKLSGFDILTDLPHMNITPVFHSGAHHLTLELTSNRGWKFWKSARLSQDEAGDKLARLIRADYYASIETFISHAQEALAERAQSGLTQISTIYDAAISSIESQIAELEKEKATAGHADVDVDARRLQRLEQTRDDVKRGLELLASFEAKIRSLVVAAEDQEQPAQAAS